LYDIEFDLGKLPIPLRRIIYNFVKVLKSN